MKKILLLNLFLFVFVVNTNAQDEKLQLRQLDNANDVMISWNKNTPEQEMKNDVKALSEKGITIKYSDIKRNDKKEIVSIKMSFEDRKGNSGNLALNNPKGISPISFFKQGEEIGFGNAQNQNRNDGFAFFDGLNDGSIMKQFNFNENDIRNGLQQFGFSDLGNGSQSKSKIIIQKDGKKPLVIEDGKVIEVAEGYTEEEIKKIQDEHKMEFNSNESKDEFDLRGKEGNKDFKDKMQKMQIEIEKMMPKNGSNDSEISKKEMKEATEELRKAKKELEEARKALESKSKTKK